MKEKTFFYFRNEASKEFLSIRNIDYSKWLNLFFCIQTGKEFNKLDIIDIMNIAAERYTNHVKAIALQEFKDEVITQVNHAKDNFPSHSFDPEFTRGITKGFQMASAIISTKLVTPK